MADGLATAHGAGIIHRDIKPENILIAKNGYAKLADFGLAKLFQPDTEHTATRRDTIAPTRPGMIAGTIGYMSPEQASGNPVDARSDIFSFGAVLYELFAGQRPFSARSDLEELQRIVHGTPEPLAGEIPVRLRMVVEKALEKDPAERYQTAREMVIDLRRASRQTGSGDAAEARSPDKTGNGSRAWRLRPIQTLDHPASRASPGARQRSGSSAACVSRAPWQWRSFCRGRRHRYSGQPVCRLILGSACLKSPLSRSLPTVDTSCSPARVKMASGACGSGAWMHWHHNHCQERKWAWRPDTAHVLVS